MAVSTYKSTRYKTHRLMPGIRLFDTEEWAQVWVRQQLRYNPRVNYFVGFRNGEAFGVSFGHAYWTDRPYVRDIFPHIRH